MNPSDLIVYGISATVMTLCAVEVAKEIGVPSRLAPVVAIVTGMLIGLAGVHQAGGPHPDYIAGIFGGIVAAFSAMGLYSGARTLKSGSVPPPLAAGLTPLPEPPPTLAPVTDVAPIPVSPPAS